MYDDFKPLRRKVGVVTLALACVFAVGWIKSLGGVLDTAQIQVIRQTFIGFVSYDGVFGATYYVLDESASAPLGLFRWHRLEIPQEDWQRQLEEMFDWSLQFHEFRYGFAKASLSQIQKQIVAICPYWLIVSPLILISMWLLLGQPRVKPRLAVPTNPYEPKSRSSTSSNQPSTEQQPRGQGRQ